MDLAQSRAARVFGAIYLLTLVLIGFAFSRFYAPFLVWNDMAETARRLFANESTFRIYLACAVLYGVGLVGMLTALYVVLRPVGRGLALFGVFCRLVYALMWFVFLLDAFGALRVMGTARYLRGLDPQHLQALAALQLASGWDAYYIGLPFYALGTVFFAYLFFKSRYIPRVLAMWGILASLFEGCCGFVYLIHPQFGAVVSVNWYEMPAISFEFLISVWFLVRGLRQHQPKAVPAIG